MIENFFKNKTPEDIRLNFFIIYGIVGTVLFTVYSIINFYIKDYSVAIFELLLALLTAVLIAISLKTRSHFFGETLGVLPLFFITVHNFVNGGFDNTGILWTYMLPPIAIFLSGLKRGFILGLIYLLTTYLYFIGGYWFTYEFRYTTFNYVMYLITFTAIYGMVALYQIAWDLSDKSLRKQKLEVERIKQTLEIKVDQLEKTKKDLEKSFEEIQSAKEQIQKQTDILVDRELKMAELKEQIK